MRKAAHKQRRTKTITKRQGWFLAAAMVALIGLEVLAKPLPAPSCPGGKMCRPGDTVEGNK